MKHLLILLIFCSSLSQTVKAQAQFGVKGGVSGTFFNEDQQQFGENPTLEIGYFVGVFVDVPMNERFHLQPEIVFKGVGDFQFLNAPIYAEYYVAEDFSLLVGPSINYFFDLFVNSFKVRADICAAFRFSEPLELQLKYTFGFEELSPNVLFLGVAYSL